MNFRIDFYLSSDGDGFLRFGSGKRVYTFAFVTGGDVNPYTRLNNSYLSSFIRLFISFKRCFGVMLFRFALCTLFK